ncbi:uncharacterized protein LOC119070108 [Bradysia coprophila]|uniref:uncharacterized protein LOC119070108 n=1 Tax=Bradysia coprophila TaxID=38358 RepID=UPI00187DA994|nr:uncharacterized protein LOC119070108 [Bradysia coprophila]
MVKRKIKTAMTHMAVKRRKVRPSGDPKSSEDHTLTSVLSLNDDCLQEIFMYLDSSDLLNTIKTNSRFKYACEQVFKRKYCGTQLVILSNLDKWSKMNLSMKSLKFSVNISNHFGHLISKLRIRFKLNKIDGLLDAIAANCDENLLELELEHVGAYVIKKSLLYVSGLQKMQSFLSNLSNQFPNLHRLKIHYRNVRNACPYSKAIIQSIPSVNSFEVTEEVAGKFFTEKALKKFVRLNRQIESLSIRVDEYELIDSERSWNISIGFIRCLDESLPMLKRLEINRVSIRYLPNVGFGLIKPDKYPIGFKNLKELKFYSFLEYHNADVGFMSFLSDSIEVLKLSTFDSNATRFNQSIAQFKNLKVLRLEYPMDDAATFLTSEQLARTVWTKYGVEQLILNNRNLTKICLLLHPSDYGSEALNNIFGGVTEYTDDDGVQWDVRRLLFGYSFQKKLIT